MMYAFSENFVLPISHDEVVHGKATILQKMNGDYEKKFPQARALYLYMFLHPGKKLNFMGSEFGQLREWDESREQDWDVLRYPIHDGFYHFFQALNRLYLEHPALWAEDYQGDGFVWLDCHQEGRCRFARRHRRQSGQGLCPARGGPTGQGLFVGGAGRRAGSWQRQRADGPRLDVTRHLRPRGGLNIYKGDRIR